MKFRGSFLYSKPYLLITLMSLLSGCTALFFYYILSQDTSFVLFFTVFAISFWGGAWMQDLWGFETKNDDHPLQLEQLTSIARHLSDSRMFLDSVIENIPNMIFVKDAKDLRFVRFNRAGEKLLGQSRESLIGKNDFDFFPEEQARAFTDTDRAVLQSKVSLEISEEPIRTTTGTRFLRTTKIPILNDAGEPLYLLGISEDVTEKKLAEKQRLALIEEKIARKEAEKSAKSLAVLVEAATQASRAKSAFIANISHEIRTPLGAMLGFAELVLDDKNLRPDQINNISTVIRNGQQLLRIVDEILDLSKVESDRIEIENISFSLSKLLGDVTNLLSGKAAEKNLKLEINISTDVPDQIVSDPNRLRQILINVIGNALKFTQSGSVWVNVTRGPLSNIEFLVTDTGIGISQEQAESLFQPFTQADSSMTRKYGGTGLGLFLSRKLANLLGGDVVLKESSVGAGSTFLVSIVAAQPKRELPLQDVSDVPGDLSMGPSSQGRVLVIDDSPDNRDLVSIFLSKAGMTVDVAEKGSEGIQKALSHNYDVVLMDIQMPEMDGYEALKILRSKNYTKPIAALTAHTMKGDREKFLESGFDDYFCKPVSRKALVESVKKLMSQAPPKKLDQDSLTR